ncbi:twin-arginine translocation signal domain-containing protein [Rhizobium grahamii]|uniref:Twin-arginine translocation signal domain-containing protein n=1 Tax=Rhizobium grahamii TaxID=1120045 RepID=A0A5Q0C7P6_9HYPH|nr:MULTISPECIES: twin-arginine translocation signal domain-containing protein [Rhizobium]QFY59987.1 twin-arginine translocation signal domain-containing protein [Rhizobium grahamii]QRM50894.1 twin-arginine translocation signal domain-containing protein [Rhizobium sp. BG6]
MRTTVSRRSLLKGAATLAAVGVTLPPNVTRAAEEDPTTGRQIQFEDDFQTLDWSVWDAGPKASTADPGFYGRSAFAKKVGDQGFNPYAIVDDPRASGGKALQISVKYIGTPMSVRNYYGNTRNEFQWISGNIQTAKSDGTIRKGWRKGYFEARMLFPRHPLTWPAFWMLNARSILFPKTTVELDVVEHKGWEYQLYGAYLHEWGQPGEHHEGTGVTTDLDVTQNYCRYGIFVDDTHCVPFFERKPVIDTRTGVAANWQITRAPDMDKHDDVFWPLLTLALHPDYPFPNPLKEEDKLSHMRVDYFRAYV